MGYIGLQRMAANFYNAFSFKLCLHHIQHTVHISSHFVYQPIASLTIDIVVLSEQPPLVYKDCFIVVAIPVLYDLITFYYSDHFN